MLVTNELRTVPDYSGLQLLTHVINKINEGEFLSHVSLLLSAASLIPLKSRAADIRPIVTGIVRRRLATRALMLTAISGKKTSFAHTR